MLGQGSSPIKRGNKMKKEIDIKIQSMCYENNELHLETKNEVYHLRDRRVICILADRLTEMKKEIQKSEGK